LAAKDLLEQFSSSAMELGLLPSNPFSLTIEELRIISHLVQCLYGLTVEVEGFLVL
jgi:hypothetical protein